MVSARDCCTTYHSTTILVSRVQIGQVYASDIGADHITGVQAPVLRVTHSCRLHHHFLLASTLRLLDRATSLHLLGVAGASVEHLVEGCRGAGSISTVLRIQTD